jgi:hypothetical protein
MNPSRLPRLSLLVLLAFALPVIPALPARADSVVIVSGGPPYGPHGPHFGPRHRPPPPPVVVVEPAPPPVVVVQPAPVVVSPAPTAAAQSYCREFQTQTVVAGQVQPSYGTACQQPDGSWKIVSQKP